MSPPLECPKLNKLPRGLNIASTVICLRVSGAYAIENINVAGKRYIIVKMEDTSSNQFPLMISAWIR